MLTILECGVHQFGHVTGPYQGTNTHLAVGSQSWLDKVVPSLTDMDPWHMYAAGVSEVQCAFPGV